MDASATRYPRSLTKNNHLITNTYSNKVVPHTDDSQQQGAEPSPLSDNDGITEENITSNVDRLGVDGIDANDKYQDVWYQDDVDDFDSILHEQINVVIPDNKRCMMKTKKEHKNNAVDVVTPTAIVDWPGPFQKFSSSDDNNVDFDSDGVQEIYNNEEEVIDFEYDENQPSESEMDNSRVLDSSENNNNIDNSSYSRADVSSMSSSLDFLRRRLQFLEDDLIRDTPTTTETVNTVDDIYLDDDQAVEGDEDDGFPDGNSKNNVVDDEDGYNGDDSSRGVATAAAIFSDLDLGMQDAIDAIRKEASKVDTALALDKLASMKRELRVARRDLIERNELINELRSLLQYRNGQLSTLELERDLYLADASKLQHDMQVCMRQVTQGKGPIEEMESTELMAPGDVVHAMSTAKPLAADAGAAGSSSWWGNYPNLFISSWPTSMSFPSSSQQNDDHNDPFGLSFFSKQGESNNFENTDAEKANYTHSMTEATSSNSFLESKNIGRKKRNKKRNTSGSYSWIGSGDNASIFSSDLSFGEFLLLATNHKSCDDGGNGEPKSEHACKQPNIKPWGTLGIQSRDRSRPEIANGYGIDYAGTHFRAYGEESSSASAVANPIDTETVASFSTYYNYSKARKNPFCSNLSICGKNDTPSSHSSTSSTSSAGANNKILGQPLLQFLPISSSTCSAATKCCNSRGASSHTNGRIKKGSKRIHPSTLLCFCRSGLLHRKTRDTSHENEVDPSPPRHKPIDNSSSSSSSITTRDQVRAPSISALSLGRRMPVGADVDISNARSSGRRDGFIQSPVPSTELRDRVALLNVHFDSVVDDLERKIMSMRDHYSNQIHGIDETNRVSIEKLVARIQAQEDEIKLLRSAI